MDGDDDDDDTKAGNGALRFQQIGKKRGDTLGKY